MFCTGLFDENWLSVAGCSLFSFSKAKYTYTWFCTDGAQLYFVAQALSFFHCIMRKRRAHALPRTTRGDVPRCARHDDVARRSTCAASVRGKARRARTGYAGEELEMAGEEWEEAGEVYLAPVRRCMTAVN
jgi:hypothetical protein